jgi:exosortase
MRSLEKNDLWIAAITAVLAGVFAWAYWPTLAGLAHAWNNVPDYSHGFFVAPLAIFILWARRAEFPGISGRLAWLGLGLLALSVAVRMVGARFYLDAIDGWSILLWVGGVVWFLCGWPVFRWSLPAVVFLWFMVPLPFRLEHALSLPLQHAATRISCWILQCFGQPALPEGTRIYLGDVEFQVSQECAGLRIFVGIVALAFIFVVLVRRTWWEKSLLAICIVPIALAANVSRIVATGMLFQCVDGESSHAIIHDWAGYVMIPYAAGLFALAVWYLGKLVQTVDIVDAGDIARRDLAEV